MRKFVVFFIFAALSSLQAAESETIPDVSDSQAITKSSSEEGEEKVWAIESIQRSELIYPSNYGQAGIFRVRSAESLPQGALTFGVGGEFYSVSNAPLTTGVGSNQAKTIAESLFLGFSPVEHLTLAIMRRNSSTTFGIPEQLISSLGDINFSASYSILISPSFAIAPIANFLVASNFNALAPSGNTLSVGVGAAATYSLFPATGVPLFTHANVIYSMPQIRTSKATANIEPEMFFNFSRYHTVTLGLGVEYKIGDFIPFMEYFNTVEAGTELGVFSSPSKISLGTRFTPLENKSLSLLLGADIGVGKRIIPGAPFTPDYQILGQISYTVGITSTERKHYFTTHDVRIVDRKFIIGKNINFKVGKADLETGSSQLLDQIARVIKENNIRKLLIVGHTDSTAPEDFNLKLSIDRANTVKRYLVSQGIPEDSLMAQGYGKRKPKASNATEAGRQLNRRVEFIIVE